MTIGAGHTVSLDGTGAPPTGALAGLTVTGPGGPNSVTKTGYITVAAPADVIIDNGGAGTSYTGTWSVSSGTNSYGSKSVFSSTSGATYTWSTSSLPAGAYEVFM